MKNYSQAEFHFARLTLFSTKVYKTIEKVLISRIYLPRGKFFDLLVNRLV